MIIIYTFCIVKCGGVATATPPTLVGVDAPAEAEVDYSADGFTFHRSWTSEIEGVLFSMLDIMEFKEVR